MILDNLTSFCNALAVTSAAKYSTDDTVSGFGTAGLGYVDLGNMDCFENDGAAYINVGEPIAIVVGLNNKLDDAGTPRTVTLAISVQVADDAAFTSNLTTLMTLGTFAAGAVAGTLIFGLLPPGALYSRYMRVVFRPSGTLTGGKVYAHLCKDYDKNVIFPSRINIL